uniref:ABC transporter permease n=1 Tax=Thermofilum adornatum TaxID=1365176 RepID=A0A7C1CFI6_9CREN
MFDSALPVMTKTAQRIIIYLSKRAISIFITIVIATYITIIIANMGGYVDEIKKAEITERITQQYMNNPAYKGIPRDQLQKLIQQQIELEIHRTGLDRPFLERSITYLWDGLTLNLGRALYMTSDSGSRLVKNIILERLPQTVLLFTTATIINFFIHLAGGLYLSRNYGSKLDKIIVSLAPLSTMPGWFYGIFLILIFAAWLHILPYGGLVDYPPPEDPISYFLSVLKHAILPLSSWIISGLFVGIYTNRTFFLIFSTEDYVEAAKAKGLPPRLIERRYILRPTLPPIITGLALSLIGSWQGAIITETVFNWPGLGLTTYQALQYFDVPVIVGLTVIYAYLLGLTVLVLDLVYSIVDPRIRSGLPV